MKQFVKLMILFLGLVIFGTAGSETACGAQDKPMLAAGNRWYPFSVAKSNITSVEFRDSYEPDGTEVAVKNVDIGGTGEIRSYLLAGRKKVIVAGNGSGGILANPDCSGMFEGFITLQSVNGLELINTSNVKKMNGMFHECNNLAYISFISFDTSNVVSMNSMFQNCNSLENIDLQYWDLSNVADMSYMFSNCACLDNLSFRLMKDSSLEDISYMFSDCYELQNLDIRNMQTNKVTNMKGCFKNCTGFTVLDLRTFNTEKVQDFSEMFEGCENIKTITLKNWDTSNAANMDSMFKNCRSVESIDVRWKTNNLQLAQEMFKGCQTIQTLTLNGFTCPRIEKINYIFEGCTSLIRLDLSGLDLSELIDKNQSDLFGDTVYSSLQTFIPPLGVRIAMEMPKTGEGHFLLAGEELETLPKNLEVPLSFEVTYRVIFSDQEDGTVYSSTLTERGTSVATPSQPAKESDRYVYEFLGWHLENGTAYAAEPVYSDLNVFAFWDKTEKPIEDPPEAPENSGNENGTGTSENQEGNSENSESGTSSANLASNNTSSGSTSTGSTSSGGSSSGGGSSGGGSSGGGYSGGGSSGGGGGGGISYKSNGTTPSGSKLTVAGPSVTYSSFWKTDAKGVWKIYRPNGQVITSAWLCDDAVSENGKNVWYLIGTNGEMLSCGLVQDNSGNYYSLETTHNGFFGMLRYKNGFYSCGTETLYITFDHAHNGSFGAITSTQALEQLKRLYGVTRFSIGNEQCIYTSSF